MQNPDESIVWLFSEALPITPIVFVSLIAYPPHYALNEPTP
jgi:hypothetical protein